MYSMAFAHTSAPTWRPSLRLARSASSKWMPPRRREKPASAAASLNVFQRSVTGRDGAKPGSTLLVPAASVTSWLKSSLPVNRLRISAAAALKPLWPDGYSANGGVMNTAGW